jgi:glucose-6-phosphate dehydrogenase assembly protein OpcA
VENAMLVHLSGTTTSKIAQKIAFLRQQGAAISLGRVLTLVIITQKGIEEEALEAAHHVGQDRPFRIIVLVDAGVDAPNRLDAQLRMGGDAGLSEVIVLYANGELARESGPLVAALLPPDAPIVAWWPNDAPNNVSDTSIGRIAHRRITDAGTQDQPHTALKNIRNSYRAGDTDLAWTRLTNWRIQLAAVLDQADGTPISAVTVEGTVNSPSTMLLATWLTEALNAAVTIIDAPGSTGIQSVQLHKMSGDVRICRLGPAAAELTLPGQETQLIPFPSRTLQDCLAEELRRLEPDQVFGETIQSLDMVKIRLQSRTPSTQGTLPGRERARLSLLPA